MPQCQTHPETYTIFPPLINTLLFWNRVTNYNCHMNEFKTLKVRGLSRSENTKYFGKNFPKAVLWPFHRLLHCLCTDSGDCMNIRKTDTLFQPKLLVCFVFGFLVFWFVFLVFCRVPASSARMENNLSTRKWWWRQREGGQESKGRWKFQMPLLNWPTFFLASLP